MQLKSKNLMVGALAAFFVLVLWWMMIYSPTKSQASKAQAAADAAEQKVTSLQQQFRTLGGPAKLDEKKQAANLALLQGAIPPDPALSKFVRDTDTIEKASHVAWVSITPSQPTTTTGLTEIHVAVSIKGQYANVMDYLSRLAALQRIFVIDSVSVAGQSDSTTGPAPSGAVFGGELQVQLAGRIFTEPFGLTPSASSGVSSVPGSGH